MGENDAYIGSRDDKARVAFHFARTACFMNTLVKGGYFVALLGFSYPLFASDAVLINGTSVNVPLNVLRQSSDVVVVATVLQIGGQPGAQTLQLQTTQILQGQPTSSSIAVQVTPPSQIPTLSLPSNTVGQTGLWFLKLGQGGYQVLPLVRGLYIQSDFFLPVQDLQQWWRRQGPSMNSC